MKSLVVALAESLDKSFPWAVGFFFGNTELSLELWDIISGISGFDDQVTADAFGLPKMWTQRRQQVDQNPKMAV